MKISDVVILLESKSFFVADEDGNNKEPVIAWALPLSSDLDSNPIPITPLGRSFNPYSLIYPDGSVWSGLGSGEITAYESEFDWLAAVASKGDEK